MTKKKQTKDICKFTEELAEYKLKPNQFNVLNELLESKGNVQRACKAADVAVRSYYNWARNDVFQLALQGTKEELKRRRLLLEDYKTLEVEDALYENAKNGKENSIMFYLKNRDPKRWKNDYIQGQEYTQYTQNNTYYLKTEVGEMSNKQLIEAAKELALEMSRGNKDVSDKEITIEGSAEVTDGATTPGPTD